MKIWAFGDSFTAGDQDIENDQRNEVMHYNRYNVSFAAVIAKKYNVELENFGQGGCSNFVQVDRLFMNAERIHKDDLVLFTCTTPYRERIGLRELAPKLFSGKVGQNICDAKLIYMDKLIAADMFYTISVIDNIKRIYGLNNVYLFNAFYNWYTDLDDIDKEKFNLALNYFMGIENTFFDILNDNWGVPSKGIAGNMDEYEPPPKFAHLYTRKMHPNIQGHQKIANFLINNFLSHIFIKTEKQNEKDRLG